MAELDKILAKYPDKQRESLIQILQDVQSGFGFISEEAILTIGSHLDLPTSKIYGLATFYEQFRFKPKGKYHLQVCGGTSCHISPLSIQKELEKLINLKDGEITSDGLFSLEVVSCIGACGHSPLLIINNKYHTDITISKLKSIIQQLKKED